MRSAAYWLFAFAPLVVIPALAYASIAWDALMKRLDKKNSDESI